MEQIYDVGIIGAGVSGAFSALRLAENHPNVKAIIFELGRPPGKRRRQLEGWLGCFPSGDGKLYTDEKDDWVQEHFSQAGLMKEVITKSPNVCVKKIADKLNYTIQLNNYIQWIPDNIHKMSRQVSKKIEDGGNVELSFDNEVYEILKKKDHFLLGTSNGDFKCKKVIISVGRSGWRWLNDLYHSLHLLTEKSVSRYGVCLELPEQYMKKFNKSHCSFIREDVTVGPLKWNGMVLPEDHADMVTLSFRSNEERWKKAGKDKVFFDVVGNISDVNDGIKESERLAKLAFLLYNDRIGKEKIKLLIKKKSVLSQLPEYNWLIPVIKELDEMFPSLIMKGYFHSPVVNTKAPTINLVKNQTEIEGLYIAGESSGAEGIMSSAISGKNVIDNIFV